MYKLSSASIEELMDDMGSLSLLWQHLMNIHKQLAQELASRPFHFESKINDKEF